MKHRLHRFLTQHWLRRVSCVPDSFPFTPLLVVSTAAAPEPKDAPQPATWYHNCHLVSQQFSSLVFPAGTPSQDPLSVRQMLIAMLPEGLCVPADQRHAYQHHGAMGSPKCTWMGNELDSQSALKILKYFTQRTRVKYIQIQSPSRTETKRLGAT